MRVLESYRDESFKDNFESRIDLARTIDSAPLSDETWDWLDLVGHAVSCTQDQAAAHDTKPEWFRGYEDYKWVLVGTLAKDINTLFAIYLALRCEWTHQAAALLRMLCESLITLRFIAQEKVLRSKLFIGYAVIDEYEGAANLLQWDAKGAPTVAVERMKALVARKQAKYDAARPNYRKGGGWSGKTVKQMAKETGSERLYHILYGQTSAYIHGSAWSLRSVGAFTFRGYDSDRALVDISMIIRLTLAVWFEWAAFCDKELGWTLCAAARLDLMKQRLEELQAALDAKPRRDMGSG
jgi:hypothetical protein